MLKAKRITVRTCEQAAPNPKRPDLPGNWRINDMWFSAVEMRNNFIAAKLNPDISPSVLIGCTINYNELEITQAMLDAGGGEHKEIINGREVSYKMVGINNIGAKIDWSTVTVTENHINLAELSQKLGGFGARRTAPVRTARPAANTGGNQDTLVEDNTEEIKEHLEMPASLEGTKEDEHGNRVNADGTPLTAEQTADYKQYVESVAALEV